MDWSFYGPLAAVLGFLLFAFGHMFGYNEGRQDEREEQERRRAAMDAQEPPALWLSLRFHPDTVAARNALDDEQAGGQ